MLNGNFPFRIEWKLAAGSARVRAVTLVFFVAITNGLSDFYSVT